MESAEIKLISDEEETTFARKRRSINTEDEVEYFGKKESQTDTRDSGASNNIDNPDLLYFIEPHDT